MKFLPVRDEKNASGDCQVFMSDQSRQHAAMEDLLIGSQLEREEIMAIVGTLKGSYDEGRLF